MRGAPRGSGWAGLGRRDSERYGAELARYCATWGNAIHRVLARPLTRGGILMRQRGDERAIRRNGRCEIAW